MRDPELPSTISEALEAEQAVLVSIAVRWRPATGTGSRLLMVGGKKETDTLTSGMNPQHEKAR